MRDRDFRLLLVAGILPAGIDSGLHAEPGQHVPVEHEPGNDDRDEHQEIIHFRSFAFAASLAVSSPGLPKTAFCTESLLLA